MRIYLDHHATTPLDRRVLEAMLPYFGEKFGNPSSRSHRFGWEAEEAVERARAEVAALIGASAKEIVFTSGATEADNLALKGVLERAATRGRRHLVVSALEHRAVLEPARKLESQGIAVTRLAVPRSGIVDPDDVARALRPDTALVSVMAANNEIGTLQPLAAIGRLTRERGVWLHSDAAQAAGKVPLDVDELGVDLLSLSAHKMYGPKGVGALYVRRRGGRVLLEPQTHGGGQEGGLRSGTLAVPSIVGFGRACVIAAAEMPVESRRLRALGDRLLAGITAGLDDVPLHGDLERRLPGSLSLSFAGVEGEALLVGLKDIAVSSGSACESGAKEPSHVLRALGVPDQLIHSAIRFGIGRFNTEAEIDRVIERVVAVVRRLREMSPLYDPAPGAAQPGTVGSGRWS